MLGQLGNGYLGNFILGDLSPSTYQTVTVSYSTNLNFWGNQTQGYYGGVGKWR